MAAIISLSSCWKLTPRNWVLWERRGGGGGRVTGLFQRILFQEPSLLLVRSQTAFRLLSIAHKCCDLVYTLFKKIQLYTSLWVCLHTFKPDLWRQCLMSLDSPDSPVVRTQCFHCKGGQFLITAWGTKIPHPSRNSQNPWTVWYMKWIGVKNRSGVGRTWVIFSTPKLLHKL